MKNLFLRWLGITIGCLIASASINLFLMPNHLLSGGLTGIAIVVYFMTNLPVGMQVLLYNLPLFFAAYKTLGKKYLLDILFGTVMFSLTIDATHFLSDYSSVNDPMLAAIFGGLFNGIGYGIIFRCDGSSGGLDIVSAIIKKYYSMNIGSMNFMFNCVIMIVAAIFFGPMPAMYTLISMFVSATLTDKVVGGLVAKKVLLIISDKAELIAEDIIREVGRGVTYLDGEGAFSRQKKRVLFVVVNLTQIAKIKNFVNAFDPMAFMIVLNASEVMGRGFTLPGLKFEDMLRERQSSLKNKLP